MHAAVVPKVLVATEAIAGHQIVLINLGQEGLNFGRQALNGLFRRDAMSNYRLEVAPDDIDDL